jgi:hypothetical protein
VKYLVNIFRDIDDREIILTEQFTMDEAYSQKGRGNVIRTGKIKNEVGICSVIFEIGNSVQQFGFNR